MEALSSPQLEALKYCDLQCLAKSVGLKANFKATKLLKVLKQHFREENGRMNNKRTSSSTVTEEENGSQIPINLSMITKRRRKQKYDNALENAREENLDYALEHVQEENLDNALGHVQEENLGNALGHVQEENLGNALGHVQEENLSNALGQVQEENLNKEKTELDSEKEILLPKDFEGSEDGGFGEMLKINQNDEPQNSGMAGNVEGILVTPSQQKEKHSTRQKTVENSLSGKKTGYIGSQSKSGRIRVISTTPNFKKIHEAQFKKMLSIDDYIERKNKMIHNFNSSVNQIKMLAKKNKSLNISQKENLNSNSKVSSNSRWLLLSPLPQRNRFSATGTPVNLRHSVRNSLDTANKSILSKKSSFSSTSLSSTKMNVRFSESTKDNEDKRSLTKTPSGKSLFLKNCTQDNQMSSKDTTDFKQRETSYHLRETPRDSAVTPFKFTNQTTAPTSTKKPVFDLQASLSRPLTYQPHRGKLKPWGSSSENNQRLNSHKRCYKEPLLQTREKRREKHIQGRKQRKDQKLSTLRRLTVD